MRRTTKILFFLFLILLVLGGFFYGENCRAEIADIIINELLPKPDPVNALSKEEFVELYSSSDNSENLDGWYLKDRAGKTCNLSGKTIGPEEFLVIINNSEDKCVLALNDTQGEFLGLYNPVDADPISSVSYEGSAKKGRSYNFNGTAWRWSQFLTAGKENVFNNEPYGTVKIDADIFVNVYADFFISMGDADGESVKVTWNFGDGHKSYLEKTRHKYELEGIYQGSVKLSDGNEDVLKNFMVEVKKYPTPKIKIVKMLANPKGNDTDKTNGEEIYLKNTSKKKINLKTWSLATGDKNLYNHPITKDFIIQPGKTKKITRKYSLFTLNNKKGAIELHYPNGEVASRVKYDKKKETVKDDEVYELSEKKWQWNAPPEEMPTEETLLPENSSTPENINPETELDVSDEEIALNLGKFSSSENKIALAEIKFKSAGENLLQSRETPGIVLGAFSARNEFHKPIEIKSINSWQKTLQKSNQLFNLLINQILSLI